MVDGAEDLLCKDILRNEVFPDCSSKVPKEVQNGHLTRLTWIQHISSCGDSSRTTFTRITHSLLLLWKQPLSRRFRPLNRRIVGELSTTLHAAFKNAFDRTVDIWSMYSSTILDILFLIWGQTVENYEMLSFHLSINVIIIVVSFKILDLCPIVLFQQLWNTL